MYWLAYLRFGLEIGVEVTEKLKCQLAIRENLAKAAWGVISLGGVEILIQHPVTAAFDSKHRLHCLTGPALAWSDGYSVYAANGERLPIELGLKMVIEAVRYESDFVVAAEAVLLASQSANTFKVWLEAL